jgi:hypothetical protein
MLTAGRPAVSIVGLCSSAFKPLAALGPAGCGLDTDCAQAKRGSYRRLSRELDDYALITRYMITPTVYEDRSRKSLIRLEI